MEDETFNNMQDHVRDTGLLEKNKKYCGSHPWEKRLETDSDKQHVAGPKGLRRNSDEVSDKLETLT